MKGGTLIGSVAAIIARIVNGTALDGSERIEHRAEAHRDLRYAY
jgi:hypothetical protein